MFKICFLFLIFCFPLFAEKAAQPQNFEIDVAIEAVDKFTRNPITWSPYQILPKVNIITGNYIDQECDFILAGAEPLSIRRFYNHLAPRNERSGCWLYNPETYAFANFEYSPKKLFAVSGESNGHVMTYEKIDEKGAFLFDFSGKEYIGEGTGQTHPLNTQITYRKEGDPNGAFQWIGEIKNGGSNVRHFVTPSHTWLRDIKIPKNKNNKRKKKTFTPHDWTPYRLPITEERKPNGNIIRYSYTSDRLSTITAFNSVGKELGSLQLCYSSNGIEIVGSDGRKASFSHTNGSLTSVNTLDKPPINYIYDKDGYLTKVQYPDGRSFVTEYDHKTHKVIAQYGPTGPIGRFVYNDGSTTVFDAEDNKTIFQYDDKKRITSVERCQGEKLYCIDNFEWDAHTGNLLSKEVSDALGILCRKEEYVYDKNHNIIEETVGDGKESYAIYHTYSDDGFNLKLSETDGLGKITRYSYKPETNLLISELIYDEEIIRKRTFFSYDESGVCIKRVIDDGISEEPDDLTAITFCKITNTYPKQDQPCAGLPEIIEEKTIDQQGDEILLHRVHYTYHPSGKVLREEHYDAKGGHHYDICNTYDTRERLISQTSKLNQTTTYEYDANNNLLALFGPRIDMRRSWSYDPGNRPVKEESNSLITQKIYDKLGRMISDIDGCGNKTDYTYDLLGNVTQISYPDGSEVKREYNVLGNMISELDPNGYRTIKKYNFRGQPTCIYHPDGFEEHFSYHPDGTLRSHFDRNEATTIFIYDIFQNPLKTEVYSPSNKLIKVTSATYSPFCLLSSTDGEGKTTFYEYDFAGRKIAESLGERKITYDYDAHGQLTKSQKNDSLHIYKYDRSNRLIEKRVEDIGGRIARKERYAYDGAGNRIQMISSKGVIKTVYDAHGQISQIKDPLGNITTISHSYQECYTQSVTDPKGIKTIKIHDARGKEIEKTVQNRESETIKGEVKTYDPSGNLIQIQEDIYSGTTYLHSTTTKWVYGPFGRVEKVIEDDQKETKYTYDHRGRFRSTIKPDSTEIFHAYDDLGRLSRLFSSHKDIDYHYTYDHNDRLLSVYDAVSKQTTSRIYDPYGNLIAESLANKYTLSGEYDPFGKRQALVLPDGTDIHYIYRADDLYQIKRKNRTITYAERDLEGYPTYIDLPFDSITIERDALSRIKKYEAPSYHCREIHYDSVQNLCHYTYTDSLGMARKEYTYDDLGQITSEDSDSYMHDSLFNRLSKNETKYPINTLCQLTASCYSYDPNGNLLSDGEWRYGYDSLNRLTTVFKEKLEIHYTYDSFDRRLSKKVMRNGLLIGNLSFLWDGKNEIGAVVPGGRIVELRLFGDGIAFLEINDKDYYPIHDHLNNLVTLVDAETGEAAQTCRYTAFGEELIDSQLSPWRFSGKRVDPETGLVYFGRRYYHPSLGRWLTPDPAGFIDGNNLYAYVKNNPLSYVDADGEFGFLSSLVGAIIGAISSGFHSHWDMGAIFKGAVIGAASGFVGFGMGNLGYCLAGNQGVPAILAGGLVGGASGGATGGALSAVAFGGDVLQGIGTGAMYGTIAGGISAGLISYGIPDALANTTGGTISGFAHGGASGGGQGALYSFGGALLHNFFAANGFEAGGVTPKQGSPEWEEMHAGDDTYLTTPNLKFEKGNLPWGEALWKYTRPILVALLGNGYSHVWHTKDYDYNPDPYENDGYVPAGRHYKFIRSNVEYKGQDYALKDWANYKLFTNSCCSRFGYLHPARYYSDYHYPDLGVYWWRRR